MDENLKKIMRSRRLLLIKAACKTWFGDMLFMFTGKKVNIPEDVAFSMFMYGQAMCAFGEYILDPSLEEYIESIQSIIDEITDDDPEERTWCCWVLSESEILKVMNDVGIDIGDKDREEFIKDVVDKFKDALSIMAEEWEVELKGCVNDVIEVRNK